MERSREAHRTTRPLGSLLHWRQRRIDPQDRTKFGTENRTGAVAGWPNTENGTTIGGQANQRGGGRRRVHLGGRLEERAVEVLVTTAGSAFSFGAWSPYSSGPRSISTPTPRTRPTGTGPIYVPTCLRN